MEIIIGIIVALAIFFIAYTMIKPKKDTVQKSDKTEHYNCDVCKGQVCECRKEDG